MSQFNLIEEPWIPVRMVDGRRAELGLRSALREAKSIAAIEDTSPLVVGAVHRLLLAVLYRALNGPTDIEQAKRWFNEGWPPDQIDAYFDTWRDRFWLFDDQHPFGQVADFEPKKWHAWTMLAAEHNANNAKVLFDHIDVNAPGEISAGAAARWLLATQTFAVSAGKSELAHTGTAPSATAAMALPVGTCLFDTLCYALVPQNHEVLKQDLPLWERGADSVEQLKERPQRMPNGLSDLYTWRTRSIRFNPASAPRVERVAFASGVDFLSGNLDDPMLAYRMDEKRGKLPIQFRDRGIWRDFDSLLPDETHLAPRVIEHAAALSDVDIDRAPIAILVLGQLNDNAKIVFWRMERFVFPPALRANKYIRSEVRSLLSEAEKAEYSLQSACREFARHMISRGDTRSPTAQDISKFIAQMAVIPAYWSSLEAEFHRVLGRFSLDHDEDDVRADWLEAIHRAMREAWNKHRHGASKGDAWTIRALVLAERILRRKVAELKTEIEQLRPAGEAA
jgi:CRISPR system Cascade subunit CasA